MIPRVLHRIWLDHRDGARDPLPQEFARNGQQWQALHPDWDVMLWRDRGELPPMNNARVFADAARWYPRDWKRFEADVLRLELLWRYGGVYVDTDVRPVKPVDELLDGVSCLVGRSPQSLGGWHPITNAVMAATPRHPYIAALLNQLAPVVRQYHRKPLSRSIGPWHLTRVWESGEWPDVTVLGSGELYGGEWLRHSWNTARRRRGEGAK